MYGVPNGAGIHRGRFIMILFNEGVWLIAVGAAVSAVSSILWVIIQATAIYEGHKPHLIGHWRNLKEIKQLFRNQDNPARRRWYMLMMHLFLGCMYVLAVCFVAISVLFFIDVLR